MRSFEDDEVNLVSSQEKEKTSSIHPDEAALPPAFENATHAETQLAAATGQLSLIDPVGDCNDALLDSMDGCVDYVEGVNSQYAFEYAKPNQSLITLPQELDYLNLCGLKSDAQTAETRSNSSTQSTSPVASQPSNDSCAICFETNEEKRVVFAKLPCCGKATSTVQICTSCIILLSSPTSDGSSRVGKCPRCRSWIVIATPEDTTTTTTTTQDLSIQSVQAAGRCRICNQIKDHLVEKDAVCDACFFGRCYPLLYECSTCHTTQRIPHPMYRYQPSPIEFGTVTWACHDGLCANFTLWRILPEQVRWIPVGDTPEAWGSDFLEVARARVQRERQQIVPSENEHCWIL